MRIEEHKLELNDENRERERKKTKPVPHTRALKRLMIEREKKQTNRVAAAHVMYMQRTNGGKFIFSFVDVGVGVVYQ